MGDGIVKQMKDVERQVGYGEKAFPPGVDGSVHVPVLRDAVLDQLGDVTDKIIVDATLGGGGYSAALLRSGAKRVIGIDRDKQAIERAQHLVDMYGECFTPVHDSFAHLANILDYLELNEVDAVVADLGISSDQLDSETRGFSFRHGGVLDMRMDESATQTAADILNTASEAELVRIFRNYGDEPKAKPLAKRIVAARIEHPFETVDQFLAEIETIYPKRFGGQKRSHPAMRIFQALRIAVNGELDALESLLPQACDALSVGGRVCIVTFHSLEDRMVKRYFAEKCVSELDALGRTVHDGAYKQPVKKVKPTADELAENPRARSAVLRVLEKREV